MRANKLMGKHPTLEELKAQARAEVAQEALAAKNLLSQESESALGILKRAAAEEVQKISNAAASALKVSSEGKGNDHDTLISFGVKIDNMDAKFTEKFAEIKADTKEIKDGTSRRIDTLESTKLDTKESYHVIHQAVIETKLKDHEDRVKSIELWKAWIIGASILVGVVSTMIVYIYFTDIGRLKDDLAKHEATTNEAIKNLSR